MTDRRPVAVLDASVWVTLFRRDEERYPRVKAWVDERVARDEGLASPVILLPEVTAALARGFGRPSLARRAGELLAAGDLTDLHPVDADLAYLAARLAAEHRIRGCDAVYVALAAKLSVPLYTFDGQQAERAATVVEILT